LSAGAVAGIAHRNIFNQMAVQEVTMETSGASAETQSGGLNVNMVPKDGGNQFRGTFAGDYANDSLQTGSNLTDELRARGLTRTNSIRNVYDVGVGAGGPIRTNTLWFFTAHRAWGSTEELAGVYFNKTQDTLFYAPDTSRPGTFERYVRDAGLRLTWQATSKQKIAVTGNLQDYRWQNYTLSPTVAPEAAWDFRVRPNQNFMGTWSYPVTSRILFEAGGSFRVDRQTSGPQPETGNANRGPHDGGSAPLLRRERRRPAETAVMLTSVRFGAVYCRVARAYWFQRGRQR